FVLSHREDEMNEKPTVGFIGLGIMGQPMARNVLINGYPLVVYDLSPAAVAALTAQGASAADSPRHLAEQVDIVLLCLPDSPDVQAAMLGPDGVLAGTRAGQIVIDMSTISPVVARELAT